MSSLSIRVVRHRTRYHKYSMSAVSSHSQTVENASGGNKRLEQLVRVFSVFNVMTMCLVTK